jgi:hypothetical protein
MQCGTHNRMWGLYIVLRWHRRDFNAINVQLKSIESISQVVAELGNRTLCQQSLTQPRQRQHPLCGAYG